MTDQNNQQPLWKSVLLHLLPGVVAFFTFCALVPLFKSWGFPSLMACYVNILLVILPTELGYLLYRAKKETGTYDVRKIIVYNKKSSLKEYLILVPVMILWCAVIFSLFAPLDNLSIQTIFSFVPKYYILGNPSKNIYSAKVILITSLTGLVLNGFAAPILEETYFRGVLLPKIDRYGMGAVVLNTVLFSLYHFFSPWQFFTRIVALLPLTYVDWKKKNVKMSICVHITANTFTSLSILFSLL